MKEVSIGMDKTVEQFIRTHGVRANRVLSVLGKSEQFIKSLQTTVGQELMTEILEKAENALIKLLSVDFKTSKDKFIFDYCKARAEYESHMNIIHAYMDKLNVYGENLEKVRQNKLKV